MGFVEVGDSRTIDGAYSSVTPKKKLTLDPLSETPPLCVVRSDAAIVAPAMCTAVPKVR